MPGLIMMAIVTNSYSNVVSSFFRLQVQSSVEELLVSPVSNVRDIDGLCCRRRHPGHVGSVVVTLVSLFFTDLQIHSYFIVVVVVVLTSTLFASGGFYQCCLCQQL